MSLADLARGARGYGALALLCLALYLPGVAALPVTDRDEARFAQASRQMLESHDFLRIRFQDEARNKKPAGIYWLQAASVALLSDAESTAIAPYRLPSLVGALMAVLLTFHFGARWLPRESAFLGAALLAASLGLTIEAHLAKTDAVLLATVVAAQGALGEIYRESRAQRPGRRLMPLLFWTAQGIGILIKGPLTPLVSILTLITLAIADRDLRWLRRLRIAWGLPLVALIAGPWLAAISFATDGAFVSDSVGNDLLGKLVHGQESHGAPPGTYLALAFLTFWPGSVALGATALLAWRERRQTVTRFLLAWIVPFWIVLELIPTKLPHYILPAYPALALLAASASLDPTATPQRRHWLQRLSLALGALIALAVPAVLLIAPLRLVGAPSVLSIIACAAGLALAAGFLVGVWHDRSRVGFGIAAALTLWITAFAIVLPGLDPIWISRNVAALVAKLPTPHTTLAASGFAEPSLVFLLGTGTKLTTGDGAADFLTHTPGSLALIAESDETRFRAALVQQGASARALGTVAGLNYSNGRRLVLTLYERVPP